MGSSPICIAVLSQFSHWQQQRVSNSCSSAAFLPTLWPPFESHISVAVPVLLQILVQCGWSWQKCRLHFLIWRVLQVCTKIYLLFLFPWVAHLCFHRWSDVDHYIYFYKLQCDSVTVYRLSIGMSYNYSWLFINSSDSIKATFWEFSLVNEWVNIFLVPNLILESIELLPVTLPNNQIRMAMRTWLPRIIHMMDSESNFLHLTSGNNHIAFSDCLCKVTDVIPFGEWSLNSFTHQCDWSRNGKTERMERNHGFAAVEVCCFWYGGNPYTKVFFKRSISNFPQNCYLWWYNS